LGGWDPTRRREDELGKVDPGRLGLEVALEALEARVAAVAALFDALSAVRIDAEQPDVVRGFGGHGRHAVHAYLGKHLSETSEHLLPS